MDLNITQNPEEHEGPEVTQENKDDIQKTENTPIGEKHPAFSRKPAIIALSAVVVVLVTVLAVVLTAIIVPDFITLSRFKGFANTKDIWSDERLSRTASLFDAGQVTYSEKSLGADFTGIRAYAFTALAKALSYEPDVWDETKAYYGGGAAMTDSAKAKVDAYAAGRRDWITGLTQNNKYSEAQRRFFRFCLARFNIDYIADKLRFAGGEYPADSFSLSVGDAEFDRQTVGLLAGKGQSSGDAAWERAMFFQVMDSGLAGFAPNDLVYSVVTNDGLDKYLTDDNLFETLRLYAAYCFKNGKVEDSLAKAVAYAHFEDSFPLLSEKCPAAPFYVNMGKPAANLLKDYFNEQKLPAVYQIPDDEYLFNALSNRQNFTALIAHDECAGLIDRFAAYAIQKGKTTDELSAAVCEARYLKENPAFYKYRASFPWMKASDANFDILGKYAGSPLSETISEDEFIRTVVDTNLTETIADPEMAEYVDRFASYSFNTSGKPAEALEDAVWAAHYLNFPVLKNHTTLSNGEFTVYNELTTSLSDALVLSEKAQPLLAGYYDKLPDGYYVSDAFNFSGMSEDEIKEILGYKDFFKDTAPRSYFTLKNYKINSTQGLTFNSASLTFMGDFYRARYYMTYTTSTPYYDTYPYAGYTAKTTGYSANLDIEIYDTLSGEMIGSTTIYSNPPDTIHVYSIPETYTADFDYDAMVAYMESIMVD